MGDTQPVISNSVRTIPMYITILAFIISGVIGFYSGRYNTEQHFAEIETANVLLEQRIFTLETKNTELINKLDDLTEVLDENTNAFNLFLRHYAANTGIIIE